MLDIRKALAATGKSSRKLGAEVLAEWKRRDRHRGKFPQPGAIGVKLGRLRAGDTKWWTNQSGALDALAQILGCRPNEIVAPNDSEPGAVPIATFAELAPILPGQDACQLRDDGSWIGTCADSLLHEEPRAWVVAPTGSGKTLALRLLRQRHGSRVVTVQCRRLVEVVSQSTRPLPLVVEVSEVDPGTDEVALKQLAKVPANVCVLAPFFRHRVRDAGLSRWRDLVWTPNADWRERLVKWANARAPKPEDLDVEDIMGFLKGIDPHERLFTTPADVLAVVARAYRAGLPKGASALLDLARENVGRLFSSDETPWTRTFGIAAVESLVERRFASTDCPEEALRLDDWARLLPADLTPVAATSLPPRSKQRNAPERVPSIQAVRILADAEVLRTTADGRLDFAPWVRAAIERETMAASLKRPDPGWALWAVEPTRRAVVDDALDAASPAALLRLARQALSADASELSTVAAIEALFSALARKLGGEWKPTDGMIDDLQKLGLRQLDLVRHLPKGRSFPGSAPLTRQAGQDRRDPLARWIGEAWTFSIAVPPPNNGRESAWILPGWSRDLRIVDAPQMLPLAHEDRRLLEASRAVVGRCIDDSLPENVPYCLLPWVIIDGPGRGWTLTKGVQRGLFHVTRLAQLVGRRLAREPTDIRERAARSTWEAALVESEGHPLQALELIALASSDLHRVVLDHLPAEAFESAIRAKGSLAEDGGRLLRTLPARLVRPALVALVEQMDRDQRTADDIEHALEALGEGDLDLLLRFSAHGYGQGYAAARRVWSLSPESALEHARLAMKAGTRLAQVWFDTAPSDQLPDLLVVLEGLGSSAPSWCAAWLAGLLPRAGHAAPAAFALLQRIG